MSIDSDPLGRAKRRGEPEFAARPQLSDDVAAGMAKLLASEYCAEVVQDSFRIHGGYGYSKEYEIER
ncbi:MAG: hypothetical protein QOK12_2968, partial [Mycobacterium sp.]|nr:hypothetical protein [Mycobacterium sp.]